MHSPILKTTIAIIFVIILFALFAVLRTVIQTVNDGERAKELRVTDPDKLIR